MKKKHEEFDDPIDLEALVPLPKNGKRDAAYYRALLERVHALAEDTIRRGVPNTGVGQLIASIKEMCLLSGVDYESIADTRTDAQVVEDTIRAVIEAPPDIMALQDRKLDLMLGFFEDGADQGEDAIGELADRADAQGRRQPLTEAEVRAFRRQGKKWADLLRKLKKVRSMVREKTWTPDKRKMPKGCVSRRHVAEECTWPLRIMLYVGRTSVESMGASGTSLFTIAGRRVRRGKPDIGHHVWMMFRYWQARNQAYIYSGGAQRKVIPYEGVLCVLPPGHSKTEIGLYERASRYVDRPDTMTILLHAKALRAQGMLGYLADMFDPKHEAGRRMRALFPHIPPLDGKPTNAKFDFKLPDSRKGNSARAAGAGERDSGADATELYIDDPLDQETAWHETEREKTHERIHGTWMTRLRGHDKFWVWNTTLWHDDDASCRMLEMLRKKHKLFCYHIDGAGGPDRNFEPVWPDSPYDKYYFKGKYETDRKNYMIIYGCDPRAEGSKMVRKLALYATHMPDGSPSRQHEDFVRTSVKCLSVDPTTTDNSKSDDTGIVYGGHGEIRTNRDDGVSEYRKVARVLSGIRMHNSPNDVVEFLAYFAERNAVHEILVEWTTGSVLFVRDLKERTKALVTPCSPSVKGVGNVGKEARLIFVQPMLDDGLRDKGLTAVVEFPGQWKNKGFGCSEHPGAGLRVQEPAAHCSVCNKEVDRLIMHEDVQWLAEQVLRFGQTADDGLDALTQWCKHVRTHVAPGNGGTATDAKPRRAIDPRLQELYDEMKRIGQPKSCWSQEALVVGS